MGPDPHENGASRWGFQPNVNSFLTWLRDSENIATAYANVLRSFHTARKGTKFAGSVGHLMTKMLSASRSSSPVFQTRSLPLDPTGALPPDPRYRLALPRSPFGPSQRKFLDPPLATSLNAVDVCASTV